MGRSHDYYCAVCKVYWSPFDFKACPCGADPETSTYDLNHELSHADDADEDEASE